MVKKYLEKTKKEAVKLYVEGWLEKQIATKLGVNRYTVGTWLDLAGVRNRKPARVRKDWPTTNKPLIDWVGEIEEILADAIIDKYKHRILNEADLTQQLQQLLDKAKLSGAIQEYTYMQPNHRIPFAHKDGVRFFTPKDRTQSLKEQLEGKSND